MTIYDKYLVEASRTFKIADHMISVTYPLIKDTKLLLVILENLQNSLTNTISALVYHERNYKRLPPFKDDLDSKFNMFCMKCVPNYEIDKSYLDLIQTIQNLINEHKQSPVEFVRKDKFVICSENYCIKSLSIADIKGFLSRTKGFMDKVETIIKQNERSTP